MHSKQIVGVVASLVVSLGLPGAVRAGDPAAGKAQSLACEACHVSETAASDVPRLAGQRETYLAKQLQAFKAGDRKDPAMRAIASQLSDSDIANLAAFWNRRAVGSDTTLSREATAIRTSKMTFPRAFPQGFVQFASMNKPDRHLVTRAYVNTMGLQAAKAGTPLPDGSAIILMNYAPKLDADHKPIADKDGIWVADQFKYYEGMEARSGWGNDIPELLRNANWSFAIFGPDKALRAEINQANCLACHKRAAATGFVYDLPKIQDRARAK
jgi:cytochrome c553